jgi:hypothetical protein
LATELAQSRLARGQAEDGGMSEPAASITVRVSLAIRRRPGRKTVVTPEVAATQRPPAPVPTRPW